VVRIGIRNAEATGAERSYRLLFQDLGDPADVPAPGATRVDYSVPVFFAADAPAGPKLEYTLKKTDASTLILTVANHGDVHEKIILTNLSRGVTESGVPQDVLNPDDMNIRRYVLAGASFDFKLHPRAQVAPGENLLLDVLIGTRHVQLPLTVQ
jgi:hypothetical protein